jgi:two-component system KDP operon response regulator KdpE
MSEPKRVLVVDDEPQITRVLRHSLSAHRYDVRTAADGISALDTFRDWHPDLIITDLQMPEMNGIEFCREIRKVSSLPIIVLSVKGEEKTKVRALDAGADDYVTKPFGIDELLARVRAALRRTPNTKSEGDSVLEDGDFRIDLATGGRLGRRFHRTDRIPPGFCRPAAQESRDRCIAPQIHPHRTMGRLPLFAV